MDNIDCIPMNTLYSQFSLYSFFKDNSDKNLLNHDVIMCYCDCMHSRPPGGKCTVPIIIAAITG